MLQRRSFLLVGAVLAVLLAGGIVIQAADQNSFTHSEELITEESGGSIGVVFDDDVYAVFSVKQNAVKADTKIKIDAMLEKSEDNFAGFAVNFGPDGQKFSPPATLSLERPLVEMYVGSDLVIWDENGKKLWSGTIDDSVQRISMKIKHFSLYYFERR